MGRSRELRQRADRPRPRRRHPQRLQADLLLLVPPGRARADRCGGHASDRHGPLRDRVANGAVPPADHPPRRRRHRMEMGAVHVRCRESGPDRDRAWRHHTGMAGGLRHRPAGRRVDRCLGLDRPLHDPAAHGHEQDRPGPLRIGSARRRWRRPGVPLDHAPEPPPGDRRLHHGHGDRRPGELRHRVHRHRRRTWRVDRRALGSRSTSSPSRGGRSAWRRRWPWSSSSSSSHACSRSSGSPVGTSR